MKTAIAALAFVTALTGFAVANRSLELSRLENLQALDGSNLESTKAAFTWVNENALAYLPVAATLRAEDLIAGAILAAQPAAVVAQK